MSKRKLKNKIEKLFKDLKILRNDNIIIHSNAAGIYQFQNKKNNNKLKLFIESVKKII